MSLAPLDLLVLALYAILVFALAVGLARRSGGSVESYFLAGRRLPWWLAGVSLMATSFSIDTPLGIAGLVDRHGVAGVWFAWCFVLGGAGMLAYALFAELWRRSAVVTDAEFVELRYGGREAAGLRLFKALYFGLALNALTLGWVLKAATTLGAELLGASPTGVLAGALALTVAYSAVAGLWGVAVSDLIQYAVILVALFALALFSVSQLGGPGGMAAALARRFGEAEAGRRMAFVPAPGEPFFGTFLTYLLVLWWAHRNASGAGAITQRLLACRDEREARRSSLLFSVGTFAVNYWPMILLALAALALFPDLPAEQGVARLFAAGLAPGFRGLVAAALLAAFMSTVDSQLNLTASYLVHDVVARFWRPAASGPELVAWGRAATLVVLLLGVAVSLSLDSIAGAWTLLAALTSGYGLVTIVRWFWWRVNAWSEILALAGSAAVTVGVRWLSPGLTVGRELLLVVAVSTPIWVAGTWLTPPVEPARLRHFVERVRPWGWWGDHGRRFRGLRRRLALWAVGSAAVLALNFALGAALFGRSESAVALGLAAAVAWLLFRRLDRPLTAAAPPAPQVGGEGQQQ